MDQRYKIIVAYDGTGYAGWAAQKHMTGIANVIQDAFALAFKAGIQMRGASRTDAGVHALGQVATFTTALEVNPATMLRAWNNVLPPAIVIRSLELVAPTYNMYANIVEKKYYYHFFMERPLPFIARYGWFYPRPVQFDILRDALNIFVGTHDFRSFSTGYERESTVRTINGIHVEQFKRFGLYRIVVRGPAFLHHMVRRIVGACLDVASREELSLDTLRAALAARTAQQTLPNAPAHGLLLHSITYQDAQ